MSYPQLGFKVMIFLNVKYLENGTRYMQLYLQWQTDIKSYYDLSSGAVFNDIE